MQDTDEQRAPGGLVRRLCATVWSSLVAEGGLFVVLVFPQAFRRKTTNTTQGCRAAPQSSSEVGTTRNSEHKTVRESLETKTFDRETGGGRVTRECRGCRSSPGAMYLAWGGVVKNPGCLSQDLVEVLPRKRETAEQHKKMSRGGTTAGRAKNPKNNDTPTNSLSQRGADDVAY